MIFGYTNSFVVYDNSWLLGSLGNATPGRRKWRRDTANDVGLCNLGSGRKGAAWR